MRIPTLGLVAFHVGIVASMRIPLDAMFDPIMKGPGDCSEYVELGAAPRASKKLANMYWDQVYDMSTEAFKQLDEDQYTKNYETRKLVQAFFGIVPGNRIEEADPGIPIHPYYSLPWKKVTTWHYRMARFVQTKIEDREERPFLACGPEIAKFQWPKDPARNAYGAVMKDSKGKAVALADLVKQRGLKYTDWWFWLITVKGQTTYFARERSNAEKKMTKADAAPGTVDAKTRNVDWCEHVNAWTFPAGHDWSRLGNEYTLKSPGILLCPSTFKIEAEKKKNVKDYAWFPPHLRHEIDLSPQPLDTDLFLMGTQAVTLYHEMWHLMKGVKKDELDDPDPRQIITAPDALRVKAHRDKKGVIGPGPFPKGKQTFVVPSQSEAKFAQGPIQCMWVAIYDYAQLPYTHIGQYVSLRTPECYAWFGLTLYLQVNGHKPTDWSSGGAREPGQPFQSVKISGDNYRYDPEVP